ncbi:MAG: type II secretion system F family protein, partial [Verrucomicrobia bacterium]|nr:type II secretion system F family protein [Verrucomicrobiota bacterium]
MNFFIHLGIWCVVWLVISCVFFSVIYEFLSLPLRRQESGRFLLDLLERELKRGRSPEHAILSLARCHDRALGVPFYRLAAHIESGLRFGVALAKVPRMLPPQVNAMLQAGERIGDIAKVLPACRRSLAEGSSHTTSAANYLFIVFLSASPLLIWVVLILNIFVMPKFLQISADMQVHLGSQPQFMLEFGPWFAAISFATWALLLIGGSFSGNAPRPTVWRNVGLEPLVEFFFERLPWRRQRMHRDFSAMLAIFLDAEVPEETAVNLAAQSTASNRIMRRSRNVVADLRSGKKLTEAIRWIDDAGEFRWRLSNAAHARTGFVAALTGWHDALDAKAFQSEQAAAQTITTGLVLFNGVFVGGVCVTVFQ